MRINPSIKSSLAALAVLTSGHAVAAQYLLTASGSLPSGVGVDASYWSPTFRAAIGGSKNSTFDGLRYAVSLVLDEDAPFYHSGVTRLSNAIVSGRLSIGVGEYQAVENYTFSSAGVDEVAFWPYDLVGHAQHHFRATPAESLLISGSAYLPSDDTWHHESFRLTEVFLNLSYPATMQHWGNDGKAFSPWFNSPSGAVLDGPYRSGIGIRFERQGPGLWGASSFSYLPVEHYSLTPLAAVPEPSIYLLFGAGLLALPLLRRRKTPARGDGAQIAQSKRQNGTAT